MNIPFNQIGQLLSLGSGPELLISFLLYIIFFLALITLFLLPDKNMIATLLIAAVLIGALIAKLSIAAARVRGVNEIIPLADIGMLAINAIMFTFPSSRSASLAKPVRSRVSNPICPQSFVACSESLFLPLLVDLPARRLDVKRLHFHVQP
ncbi:MAG: hypothetical protein U0670_20865 [Anaerolineae bacterium]